MYFSRTTSKATRKKTMKSKYFLARRTVAAQLKHKNAYIYASSILDRKLVVTNESIFHANSEYGGGFFFSNCQLIAQFIRSIVFYLKISTCLTGDFA